jgi:hypothetical protein
MLPSKKYFSHPSLVIFIFCNSTHKIETGIANRWGTTNSKPPGPIVMMEPIRTTLFCNAHHWTAFHLPPQTNKYLAKTIFLNRHILTFLHLILMCRVGHILSTGGEALTHCKAQEKPYYNGKHRHTSHGNGLTPISSCRILTLLNNRCKFVPFDLGDIFIDVKKVFFFIYY